MGDRRDRPRLITPRQNLQTLCAVEGGRLVDLYPVPVPIRAEYAVSELGWIAWADPDELNPISLWHVDAVPGRDEFAPLHLPRGQCVEWLAFQGETLWIVGDRAGYLARCPLGSPRRVPTEVTNPAGESVTRLAAAGRSLYATSDDGTHKRIVRISAGSDGRLAVEAAAELPRRNQDDFLGVAVGASWVAVLESTYSFCEESCHLRLVGPETLAPITDPAWVSVTTNGLFCTDAGLPVAGAPDWRSLGWDGDVLFLASGPRGVGVLDLRGQPRPTPLAHEIGYVGTPGQVQRVVPHASFGTVLAVTTAEGLDTVAVELPDRLAPPPHCDTP